MHGRSRLGIAELGLELVLWDHYFIFTEFQWFLWGKDFGNWVEWEVLAYGYLIYTGKRELLHQISAAECNLNLEVVV